MKSEKRTAEPKEKRTEEPQNVEPRNRTNGKPLRPCGYIVAEDEPADASLFTLHSSPAPEGRKDDDGKARFDLLPPDALWEVVRVYTFGAGKYGDRNWEKGIRWGRVFAAICRHLFAWWLGERHDPETGLSHLAHAAWGCKTLLAYELRGMTEFDERKTWQK